MTTRTTQISGSFDVRFWFIAPTSTTDFAPQISFTPDCLAEGQKILIRKVTLAHE